MAIPPLFQFGLWPLAGVLPWESEGRKYLSWFGLTDGWYTIDAGGVELLRYSQCLIDATPQWNWRTPYFDYQVVRLYEDVLDALPAALEPVPRDLLELVETVEAEEAFEEMRWDEWDEVLDLPKDSPAYQRRMKVWSDATSWWFGPRFLSRGHMFGQPDIRFWREGETVHIRWRNDSDVEPETGLPWSEVPDGRHSLSAATFLEEVQSFHDRLMMEMADRVELAASAGWPLPEVHIDAASLAAEHEERTRSLNQAIALSDRRERDWDVVRAAIDILRRGVA